MCSLDMTARPKGLSDSTLPADDPFGQLFSSIYDTEPRDAFAKLGIERTLALLFSYYHLDPIARIPFEIPEHLDGIPYNLTLFLGHLHESRPRDQWPAHILHFLYMAGFSEEEIRDELIRQAVNAETFRTATREETRRAIQTGALWPHFLTETDRARVNQAATDLGMGKIYTLSDFSEVDQYEDDNKDEEGGF